jgi:hypothetical protein
MWDNLNANFRVSIPVGRIDAVDRVTGVAGPAVSG